MKAKERKRIQSLLKEMENTKDGRKLQEEFDRKGFLSKREIKILEALVEKIRAKRSAA